MNGVLAVLSLLEQALPVLNTLLGFVLPQKARNVPTFSINNTNTSSGSSIVFQTCSNFYVNITLGGVNGTGVTFSGIEPVPDGFGANTAAVTSASCAPREPTIDSLVNCLSGNPTTTMSSAVRYCPYQGRDGRCGL